MGELLAELRNTGSAKNRAGMARYGIEVRDAFGVSVNELRKAARRLRGGVATAGSTPRTPS